MSKRSAAVAAAVAFTLGGGQAAKAGLSFYVDPGNPWPGGWYNDAVANMRTVVNAYNAYGDFGNGSIYVYYDAGIPTEQSGYGGYGASIGVGGRHPDVSVLLHESSHWLGTGTYSAYWQGPAAAAIEQQFDGVGALLNGDTQHYYPYGENYPNESSPINDARHVAVVYALREDFGIGSTAAPSSATTATLTAGDAAGTSAFNYPVWSDGHFAQQSTAYSTGNYALRTPNGYAPWTFAGSSLTVNNTAANPAGGLVFNGYGTTGAVTVKNLIVDGGTVTHGQFSQDLFQLAGKVTLTANGGTFNASQGSISVSAPITGVGPLTTAGPNAVTLTGANTYTGATNVAAGTLRLGSVAASAIASYSFDNVNGNTVVNGGVGGSGLNGTLANGATIVAGGKSGNAVSLANGASVDVNSPVVDLGNAASWTVSAWVKTTTAGSTILSKSNGNGWSSGNTILYLGSGTGAGAGGVPGGVRYGGGFAQGAAGAAVVNDGTWHQVTYTDAAGTFGVYVDGAIRSLSAGNAGFYAGDVGSVVRLGATTDAVAGDGTADFNGLLDNVQIYGAALTASQVSSLYQGAAAYGSLPTTTNVTVASGAKLDLNGSSQRIGSLTGPAGSAVALGAGQLAVNSTAASTFAGVISGAGGSVAKQGSGTLTLGGANTYTGPTAVSGGTLRLTAATAAAPVASYSFDAVSGNTVTNDGTGGTAMNGVLLSGATIVPGGRFGNAVSVANGAYVYVPNAITDFGAAASWTLAAWVKTTTPGGAILSKNGGAGWATGNSVFYLGSGAGPGAGGVPGGVRNAGGFLEGSAASTTVTDGAWHLVTYTDAGGAFGVYVDGVAQPLAAGAAAFATADVGAVVRLGFNSDTVAADGAANLTGLLDNVQVYGQALSAAQVSTLYQTGNLGQNVGPLPATTDVTVAAGAALDVNGTAQTIASLTGVAGSAVTLAAGQLTVGSAANTTFAGVLSGTGGSLVKQAAGALTLSGVNTYTGPTTVSAGTLAVIGSIASATVTVAAGATLTAAGTANRGLSPPAALTSLGTTTLAANLAAAGPAVVTLASVTVGGTSTSKVTIAGSSLHTNRTLLVTGGLTFASNTAGQLDLADNDMVVRGGSVAAVTAAVARGFNGGRFTGPGLTSSAAAADARRLTAVGVIADADADAAGNPLYTSANPFDGYVPAAADVLVKYTYYGDANLDGLVNGADYVRLDAGFAAASTASPLTGWYNGDFNYDGRVDGSDYTLIDNAFDLQGPPASPSAVAATTAEIAAVPEPAATVLAVTLVVAVGRRRRPGACRLGHGNRTVTGK